MEARAPSGEIGRARPDARTRRFLAGCGRFTGDTRPVGALHACFLRSPHANARILKIDAQAARRAPGVEAVFLSDDLARACKSWRTVSTAFPGLVSPTQRPLAQDRVAFQGEPVALVVAESRALAEDAAELIEVEYEPLPAMADYRRGLEEDAPLAHPETGSNRAWSLDVATGDVEAAFAQAACVVEDEIVFSRHTGVPLEPRTILASFDPSAQRLEARISHQMPHQMQAHLADLLDLPMSRVRVVAADVGGGFGVKMHVYPEEIAVCAATRLLGRSVLFVADRVESMLSDVHAREHVVRARMAVSDEGRITAFDIDDLHGIGAYSVYPRSSTMETVMAIRAMGAPYRFEAYRARANVVFQNKAMTGQYRSVGHPIAATVTERLVDRAARALGVDPLAFRRANYVRPQDMPLVNPAGLRLLDLSHEACLDRMMALLDYEALRGEIEEGRASGRIIGLGFAAFVEMTASGTEVYGQAGVPVAAVDTVTLALEPDGSLKAAASVAEIGQGIGQGIAQILAEGVGVPVESVEVALGDTASAPHGGGAWSSRGAAIGGEAAWGAARKLRGAILEVAAALTQEAADALDIVAGGVVDASGRERMTLRALAETVHFRGHELPEGVQAQLAVAHSYRRERDAAIPTNGIQASLVEIDGDTGIIRCRKHWVVEDCGRVVNPLLVDGQIRGGVVQGLGAALFEECRYDGAGEFLSASLADYLLPMAFETPDIEIAHVETPYSGSVIGAKGAGECGTCAAAAAFLNAVNDAIAPQGASISATPVTPERVLRALGRINGEGAP
ncbi:MAG: xanthine dehydrogenase family protein molybdopterin-binding subunit [Salinarimonadaceae bacterium]|nr:MAG: xanthine dehydrogenase family protein molybdopterin-binding subunit [Salinarimonadaceae bacterium]